MSKPSYRKKDLACTLFYLGATLGSLLLLGGCSKDGPERVPVSGKVTYQGKPVDSGEIRFFPTDGTIAPMTGALIKEGQYKADHRGGVQVGTHKVEILGYAIPSTKQSQTSGRTYGGPPQQQILPTKYNKNTELKLTIEPGSGHVTHDFNLK